MRGLTYPDLRVRPDRVFNNLRKDLANTTHRLLDYLEFVRYQQEAEGARPRRLIIMSPDAVLAHMVPSEWAGPSVAFVCPWYKHHSLSLRLARGILQCLVQSFRRRRPRPAGPPVIGAVAVWGLDRTARLDDLFWWWDSGIPPERVVLYFDRRDTPANREVVARAEQLGIRCVVLKRHAVGDSPHLLWKPAPGPLVSIKRLWWIIKVCAWGIPRGKVGRWIAIRVIDMLHHSGNLEDFMADYAVRGLFHYQEPGSDGISLAGDAAGAARIGVHWSHFPWPSIDHSRSHQVYFSWGPHLGRICEADGSCVDHLLVSGCIISGTYLGPDGHPSNNKYRSLVSDHGATRILMLFDTSLPSDGFYEFFLRRTIEDPRWGLLIKPVNDLPWVKRHLPELEALYQEALATGRVRVLDHRLSPGQAAAEADITVSVGIQSAGVLSALAGHRSIHLDYSRLHESPLSEWATFHQAGPDRLVFDDPEKLWERLNQYFDDPGADPDFGVMDDDLLRDIDPFRDGKAGQRIGEYVRWYLEGLDDGFSRDDALRHADQLFAGEWGPHAVSRGLSPVSEVTGMGIAMACASTGTRAAKRGS